MSTWDIVNALIGGTKWGGATGTGVTLTYSFPWSSGSAYFLGPSGSGSGYSDTNEPGGYYRYGFNTDQQAAARRVLQSWANVANIAFSEVADTSNNVGDIRFAFSSNVQDDAWGHAYYPGSWWPNSGDVWVDSSNNKDSWAVGSYNHEALMHEIGHSLGFKHPFEGTPVLTGSFDNRLYTVMSYTDPLKDLYPSAGYVNGKYDWLTYQIFPETPMVFDIVAIQYIYGANTNYRTGNDTYTFDNTKPFFKTIWDASGIDTISTSNFTLGCVIDLTPGNYSSIKFPPPADTGGYTPTYDGTNNLGIAYGCVIENAAGGKGNDTLKGNTANNRLTGNAGNDIIDGGSGVDTAVYGGYFTNHVVSRNANGSHSIRDKTSSNGTDTLTSIERLEFSDKYIALDIDGNGGQAYRIYQAAFNRKPDLGGLGDWIYGLDSGMNLTDVATGFINSPEFKSIYGTNPSNADYVTRLYNNVLHRAPEQAGFDYWMNQIASGLQTRNQVLANFSESPENKLQVVGLIQNGFEYIPHH